MNINSLLSWMKKSKDSIGSYLDRDKTRPGFQFVPQQIADWQQANRKSYSNYATKAWNHPTLAQDILQSTNAGVLEGGTGFTNTANRLPSWLGHDAQYQPKTNWGKASKLISGFAGFSVGPGRVIAPLESAVEGKFAIKALPKTAPLMSKVGNFAARKIAPAIAAEGASSLPLAGINSYVNKTSFPRNYAENVAGGLGARATFGMLPAVGRKIFGNNTLKPLNDVVEKAASRLGKGIRDINSPQKNDYEIIFEDGGLNKRFFVDKPDVRGWATQLEREGKKILSIAPHIPEKSKLKYLGDNQMAMGAAAGMEPYQDKDGKWKIRYNPTRGAVGMAVMGGLRSKRGQKIVKDLLSNENIPADSARIKLETKGKLGNFLDEFGKRSIKVIEEHGKAGKKIANLIRKSWLESDLHIGQQKEMLDRALKKLNKQELSTFADVAEGKQAPISTNQSDAVKAWRFIANDIYNRGKKVGLDIGFVEKYFPHDVIRGTKAEKEAILRKLSRNAQRRYGNLELARQTELPYNKDPRVLFNYIENANKRITDAKLFGKSDKNLYDLVKGAEKEGYDGNKLTRYIDQILNKNQDKSLNGASQAIRKVESFKLSPLSALTNLTQNISTLTKTDPKTMVKSTVDLIRNPREAIYNAMRVNEIDPKIGAMVFKDLDQGNVLGAWLKIIGFSGSEKLNRVIAVNAGMNFTKKLVKQARGGSKSAIRELERLGFKTDNLDAIDPLLGGKKLSEMTQFDMRTGNLPYKWQTPLGRIGSQFKGFAYNQSAMIGKEVRRAIDETKAGNIKPLVNLLFTWGVVAPAIGEIVGDVRSHLTNRKRDENGAERYLSNIAYATSFGLLDTIPSLLGKYGPKGVIGAVGGPFSSDVADAANIITNVGSSDKYARRKAYRSILRHIPGAGSTLANTLVPNSYITNYWGGINVGLPEKKKGVYLKLKQQDPAAAEKYRLAYQADREKRNQEKKLSSRIIKKVLGDKIAPKVSADTSVPTIDQLGGLSSDEFYSVYSKMAKQGAGYKDALNKIKIDPTIDEAKKAEKIQALRDKKYKWASLLAKVQREDPDKVFTAEVKYNSHGNTERRSKWAYRKIMDTPKKDRVKLIKLLIDKKVLTHGKKGTIAALEQLGIDIGKYGLGNYGKKPKKVQIKGSSRLKLSVAKAPRTPKLAKIQLAPNSLKVTKVKIKTTKPKSVNTSQLSNGLAKLTKGYKVKPIRVKLAKVKKY